MAAQSSEVNSPWFDTTGWRLNGQSERNLYFKYNDGDDIEIVVTEHESHFIFHLDNDLEVLLDESNGSAIRLQINNSWERFNILKHGDELIISWKNRWYPLTVINPFEPDLSSSGMASSIIAPMPGKLLKVFVKQGESVSENQPLAILEAMKMEHTLTAPFNGVIKDVFHAQDAFVEADATLITFMEPE
jgi:3-methylcrotonyl-CoA carboxylase alpha subunit